VCNIAQYLRTDFGCEKYAFLEQHARSRTMKISARNRGRHIIICLFIISSYLHLMNLTISMQNFSLLLYPVNSRFLFLRLMLDVVTIDGRVSGHLLVLSVKRRPAKAFLLSDSCHPFFSRHPSFRNHSRRPSLATLTGLSALRHY
jgi:hypothetical protein